MYPNYNYGNQGSGIPPGLPGMFPQQNQGPSYGKPTPNILDKKGRIKFDPTTGQIIPKDQRRKEKNFLDNPYGFNLGNIINPFIDYSSLKSTANPSINLGSMLGG